MRHFLSIAIVLFFATMMFLLARDHVLPGLENADSTAVSGAQLADMWVDTDEWMAISLNGAPLGAMRQTVDRHGDGFFGAMKTTIRTGFLKADLETAATMNERMELEAISMRLSAGEERSVALDGVVEGHTLFLRMKSATGTRHTRVALRQVPTLNATADALFAGRMMGPGDSYMLDVYDPVWGMQAGKMRVSMVGEETIETDAGPATARVAEAVMPKVRMRIWLDETDKPMRREISYVPANRHREGAVAPLFTLRLDRIGNAGKYDPRHEDLKTLPEPPALSAADVQGEDSGEPLQAFGVLPMLLRSQMKNFESSPGADDPAAENP